MNKRLSILIAVNSLMFLLFIGFGIMFIVQNYTLLAIMSFVFALCFVGSTLVRYKMTNNNDKEKSE